MSPTAAPPGFLIRAVTSTRRLGVKGPRALELLASCGVTVPAAANRVTRFTTPEPGRCLRLGNAEFLLEQDGGDSLLRPVQAALGDRPAGAFLAPRSDRSVVLSGPGLFPALRRIAAFDFEGGDFVPGLVVMTLMAGISVTLIQEDALAGPTLRLWCDPGFGDYLTDCLVALGGAGHDPTPPRDPQGTSP